MNAAEFARLIPHRPPFLFVDRVNEIEDRRVLATRYVDPESAFFRGHYPGMPIMPGVLICECCFQAGAILIAHRAGAHAMPSAGVPVLTRIHDARFRRVVRPGETLTIEVMLDDELENAYHLIGKAYVDGEQAVRVGFACMLAPREAAL